MPKPTVDAKKCTGCKACVQVCPVNVFDMKADKSVPTRASECIGCRACENSCPVQAIVVHD